jgi:hypothetical protein
MVPDGVKDADVRTIQIFVTDDTGTVYLDESVPYDGESLIRHTCKISSGGKRQIFVNGIAPLPVGILYSDNVWVDASNSWSLPAGETILTLHRVKY